MKALAASLTPILLAGLLALAWPADVAAAAAATNTLERITASGILRVGTPGDYRPYADHDSASGAWRGADIELLRALAAHLGVTLEFVPTTWSTLMTDAAAGRFDIAAGGISITRERRRDAYFSVPQGHDGKTVLAACARLTELDELRELDRPEVRIIANPGGTNEQFVRQRLKRAHLTVHRDNLTVFDELLAGRADVMITDATEARLQERLHPGVLCAAHPDRPFDRSAKALLLPRDGAFKRTVDAWLRDALARGDIAAARERWLAHPWTDSPPLLGLIDARLAVMSDVARYKWNTGGSIEDPARERELLASLVRRGEEIGVPARRTEIFFTAQFAAARRLQQDLFDLWRAQGREKLPPAPDLQQSIRPRLDRISADMVRALASADLRRDAAQAARGSLGTTLVSAAAGRIALEPLPDLR